MENHLKHWTEDDETNNSAPNPLASFLSFVMKLGFRFTASSALAQKVLSCRNLLYLV